VDLMDEFISLGSLILHDGGSGAEILRRINGITIECFCLLEKNIWRSHILQTLSLRCTFTGRRRKKKKKKTKTKICSSVPCRRCS